ncbi:hypothetical protein OEM_09000 [Mycobacterium intracellulare subsp. yongonense 05-1390]|nr:hypothetical protein OEM_09000 [Mycobacterium intracellulare subsp. yongonense 05-1390]ELR83784.1 hypothetical protein W7U_01050 [Mycobacterium sp. H4Y]
MGAAFRDNGGAPYLLWSAPRRIRAPRVADRRARSGESHEPAGSSPRYLMKA